MLRCLQLEEIERHLLEIPSLVDAYERRETDFMTKLISWLVSLENAFQQNRMPMAGDIATSRALIISAGRGIVPDGTHIQGRVTRRKLRDTVAISALHTVSSIALDSIATDRDRHRQAEEMVRRIVAIAITKRLAGFGAEENQFSDEDRWSSLNSDSDTQGGVVQLEGLVGHTDALILVNRGASGA